MAWTAALISSQRVEEGGLVGADRLRDVEVDVAVAEMAEGQRPAARHQAPRPRRCRSVEKLRHRATGTATSCLIEPPSKLCTSDSAFAQPPERGGLLERGGEHRVGGDARLDRRRPAPPRAPRRRPRCADDDTSTSTYQGCGSAKGSRASGRHGASTKSMPRRGIISKVVTRAAAAARARAEKLERRGRIGHRDEGRGDRARPGEKLQHRRGDDPERALRADEQVLEVVAGVVLAQMAHAVPDRARRAAPPRGRARGRGCCRRR